MTSPSAERIFVVVGRYASDAAARRGAVRSAHLARIAELAAGGIVLEAGAFADLSSSLILVRAADEATARALFADDVYLEAGVWTAVEVRPFDRVVFAGPGRD